MNIKKENIDAILKGMKGVTSEEGGTAYSTFANFNIELGGKQVLHKQTYKENKWMVRGVCTI